MPPGPPAPPHSPTVIEVYTPFVVGTLMNIFLYGVAVSQMYTYYRTSKQDPLVWKLLVFYLFVFDTFNSICDIGLIVDSLLLKSGDPSIVAVSPWTLRLDGLSTTLVSTPVQIFMAWRIRIITEKNLPVAFISVLSLTSFAGSIWLTVSVSNSPQFAKFDSFRAAPILWLVGSAVADIAISICLVYSLSKGRRYQNAILGIERGLNDRIHRIIRATIATGMVTTLTALVDAIVFLIKPDTTIFFSWDLTLCKLYTITLLISFNGRHLASDEDYQPNALRFSTCSETLSQMSFSQNIRSSMGSVPKTPGDGLEELYELSPRN
ncbi:hypothetical protein FB446DRAFT_88739 [Lentinula raphanica]|nr:hypothetical protein FB446DRAFT_88739 [Lentinula raphanica]